MVPIMLPIVVAKNTVNVWSTLFLNQPLNVEMSSDMVSKSFTFGFFSDASAIPVNMPTPTTGLITAIGALTAAISQLSGCARERIAKSIELAPLLITQIRKFFTP